jgi:DNA-binding phage protein
MLISDSYRDSLIESLQDPNYASLYLESHLEGDEYGFDSELFILALNQTLEALGSKKLTSEQAQIQAQELGKILEKPAPEALNQLDAWLKVLGLKLTVAVASEPLAIKAQKSPVNLEVLA